MDQQTFTTRLATIRNTVSQQIPTEEPEQRIVLDQIVNTAALAGLHELPKAQAVKAFETAYVESSRELWSGRSERAPTTSR